jgi:hypothetical protein
MKLITVIFLSIMLVVAATAGCDARERVTEEEYAQLVINLNASLLEFVAIDLVIFAQGVESDHISVNELADKRDQYEAALLTITQVRHPREFRDFDSDVLPLYDQLLIVMDAIVEGTTSGDKTKASMARTHLLSIEEELQFALERIQIEEPSSKEESVSSGPSPWLWIVTALGAVLITVLSIRKYRLSRRYQTVAKPELEHGTLGEAQYLPYCSRCGAELKPGANFCHRCGAPATRDIKRA